MAKKVFIASAGVKLKVAQDFQEILSDRMPSVDFSVWSEDVFHPSSYNLESLLKEASACSAAIFLFSKDDEIMQAGQKKQITRDNVIFEFGLFTGHLGPSRAIVVSPIETEEFHLLSDLDGFTTVPFSFDTYKPGLIAKLASPVSKICRHLEKVLSHDQPITNATLSSIGISSATNSTEDSSFSYRETVQAASFGFDLLGVGADKLTSNLEHFQKMVDRIVTNHGKVRLLLLDPYCYSTVINGEREEEFQSLKKNVRGSLERLAETFRVLHCEDELEIRSYFANSPYDVPPFRLTLIDGHRCIVSPRSFIERDRSEHQPQLVFERSSPISPGYFGAFKSYYEALWQRSRLETVDTMLNKIDTYPDHLVPRGCVHGRFQPPHTGHLHYIMKAKSHCEVLFVGITQPENELLTECHADPHRSELECNPLSFYERQEALRRMLVGRGWRERRDFVFLPYDIDSTELLTGVVPQDWMQFTTLIDDWNVVKNQRLRKAGYKVRSLAREKEDPKVSGTAIRELAAKSSPKYKEMVTKPVWDYLQEIGFEERLKKS